MNHKKSALVRPLFFAALMFVCSMLQAPAFANIIPNKITITDPADSAKAEVRKMLQSPYFSKLYSATYHSLLNRMHKDGFLPESLTGAYEGMFPRTTGALVSLFIETGRLKEAELNIKTVLDAVKQNDMERIPRVIGKKGGKYVIVDDQHQIDGQAHVILAWARLALKRGHTKFEDDTWPQVRAIMSRTCDRAFFQYGTWSIEPGLVRNIAFEHSKESRMWDTWDLLTQSFVGASLQDMATVANRRGEKALASAWNKKLDILKQGINKHLVTKRFGDPVYVEMLLPNSNGGTPYYGLGWVTLSPIAAGWEGADHEVLKNTVKRMQKTALKKSGDLYWMPTDMYPDSAVSNEIIGKGIGWEIDFSNTENDYARIVQILKLIQVVNASKPIYMEGGWLEGSGYTLANIIKDTDIAKLQTAQWKTKDAGNGEQSAWWCWAMARLRKSVGLPAEPKAN
ncbi:hypothetical protein IM792_16475 [Mucilaginibacter sp. JRF]|uniref:hypothetical protein n=1 Tax=Mucilaginibacter sp. JRF TaxID=2780088 RepID=UPI00187DEE17|nr:hypothetical protein [Mucilaginibacter sp. JRF]MBE9586050.1 hypothetical protein [Mucilaginibacter sp. JRF]